MIKLEDVPESIRTRIKSLKLNRGVVSLSFKGYEQLLEDIKTQYQLTELEVGKHIQLDLEFTRHTCKMCGKQLRYSPKTCKFPIYCSSACCNKDPDLKKIKQETCLKKYGAKTYAQSAEGRKKISESFNWEAFERTKQTLKSIYGVEHGLQSKTIHKKTQESCKQHIGVENPFYSQEIQSKIKDANLKKYGTVHVTQVPEINDKVKKTCLKKYGYECALSSPIIRNKAKQTLIENYGVDTPGKSVDIQNKIKQTTLARYGVETYFQLESFKLESVTQARTKSYQLMVQKCNNDLEGVEPLFSLEEFIDIGRGYNTDYKWKCKKCGTEFMHNFTNGLIPICRKCHPINRRQMQQELTNWLKTIYHGTIVEEDRTILKPKELDIYLPDAKVAIEFNGVLWHSTKYCSDPLYHIKKTEECEKQGIRLVHIWDKDWKHQEKQEIIKNRLSSIINASNLKHVFARKCTIETLTTEESENFINLHHLQGNANASIRLGLKYEDELVAVMTFAKPRFSKKYQWELLRYCSDGMVIGGAGKLLKYFERTYNPISLVSYADRCWTTLLKSNLYSTLGFTLVNSSSPNYIYVKDSKFLSRYQCQKHKLSQLLGSKFNPELSETENMMNNGYAKLYDCGNLVYEKLYNQPIV